MKRKKTFTVYAVSDIHHGSGKPHKWQLLVNCKRGEESRAVKAEIKAAKAQGRKILYGADIRINGIDVLEGR
jgi:hypothetical protein